MITYETIDGRKATIAYINDELEPVDRDEATMIKIIFDDGEIRFGVKASKDRLKSQFASEKRRSMALLGKGQFIRDPATGQFDGSLPGPGHGEGEGSSGGGKGGGDSKRKEGETDKEFAKRVVDKRPVPEELPEKHSDYFKNMDGPKVEAIPTSKLVSSKSDEENKKGRDNGAKRMVAGKNGEIEKRDPINVEPMGDGKYLITDGNGTFSAVQMYDWKAIPATVDASGTAEANEAKTDVKNKDGTITPALVTKQKDAASRVGMKAENKDAAEKHRDKEWVANSQIKTEKQAFAAALIAQNNFQAVAGPLAKRLGVKFENPGSKVHRVERDKSAKPDAEGNYPPKRDAEGNPIYSKDANGKIEQRKSGVDRFREKAEKYAKAELGLARVTDLARGGFVLERPEDAQKIIDELAKSFELVDEGWNTKPSSFYTDRVALFRDPETGMIGEIQFSNSALLSAKQEGGGHDIYKKAEAAEKAMHAAEKAGNERMADRHEREFDRLNAEMRDLYGSALDKLSPAWRKLIDGRTKHR